WPDPGKRAQRDAASDPTAGPKRRNQAFERAREGEIFPVPITSTCDKLGNLPLPISETLLEQGTRRIGTVLPGLGACSLRPAGRRAVGADSDRPPGRGAGRTCCIAPATQRRDCCTLRWPAVCWPLTSGPCRRGVVDAEGPAKVLLGDG